MIKLKKMVIELDQDGANSLLSVFKEYLTLQGLRIQSRDLVFMQQIMSIFGMDPSDFDKFFASCKEERNKGIDWLLGGCEGDGIKKIPLPKDYEELRKLLNEYDSIWIGEKYCK